MQVKLQIQVEKLFSNEQGTFERLQALLQQLKKTDTLLTIGRLNHILCNPSDDQGLERQRYIAQKYLRSEQLRILDQFAQQHGLENISVIERPALMELVRWVALLCPDDPNALDTFNSIDVRERFMKCAIIAGKLWSNRIYRYDIISKNYQYLPLIRKNAGQVRLAEAYWRSLTRGKYLFTECMLKSGRNIAAEFYEHAGLSIDEYYTCSLMILTQYTDVTLERLEQDNRKCGLFCVNTMLDNATTDARSVMSKYMAIESQHPQNLRSELMRIPNILAPDTEIDDALFLQRPLLVSEGDTQMGIALDLVSYSKKVSLAPYLVLQHAYRNMPEKLDRLKKDLGHAFEEGYVSSLLQSMFQGEPGVSIVLSPFIYKSNETGNRHQLSDFAIVRGEELVLIEAKAILLAEDKVQLENPGAYRREILNKYGRTSEKKAKGAGQLARAVQLLAERGWESDQLDTRNIRHVYSILLFYDNLVSTFGHVELLGEKFITALGPNHTYPDTAHVQKGRLVCSPLILMSIDELENLHEAPRHFDFFTFLSDYARYLHLRKDTLSSFIQNQPENGKYRFYRNRPMIDRLKKDLMEAGRLFFGISMQDEPTS